MQQVEDRKQASRKPGGGRPKTDRESEPRALLWNKVENRKVCGTAAPYLKNLSQYLAAHPDIEIYNGQRERLEPEVLRAKLVKENRTTVWNIAKQKKVSGNAAPKEKNLNQFLAKNPGFELYTGQDKVGWRDCDGEQQRVLQQRLQQASQLMGLQGRSAAEVYGLTRRPNDPNGAVNGAVSGGVASQPTSGALLDTRGYASRIQAGLLARGLQIPR